MKAVTALPVFARLYHLQIPSVLLYIVVLCISVGTAACSPRVAVEVPDKPITINLNVKIDHEVRVRVEKDLEKVISTDSELF